ncbi:MAG: monovalent cation/H(+) antiporter subunit G [Clostridia bacterium]|nr:monovalent cation/H(+) antiporter subunit G [Clostridia bacterium]
MNETVRFVLCAVLLGLGALCALIGILGVFKFKFVMNRMHCAAIIDTIALALILSGLMVYGGTREYIPKLITILLIFWIGSPIASHLVGRMEVDTDENAQKHMQKEGGDEDGIDGHF